MGTQGGSLIAAVPPPRRAAQGGRGACQRGGCHRAAQGPPAARAASAGLHPAAAPGEFGYWLAGSQHACARACMGQCRCRPGEALAAADTDTGVCQSCTCCMCTHAGCLPGDRFLACRWATAGRSSAQRSTASWAPWLTTCCSKARLAACLQSCPAARLQPARYGATCLACVPANGVTIAAAAVAVCLRLCSSQSRCCIAPALPPCPPHVPTTHVCCPPHPAAACRRR